jgi:hypothetical protein
MGVAAGHVGLTVDDDETLSHFDRMLKLLQTSMPFWGVSDVTGRGLNNGTAQNAVSTSEPGGTDPLSRIRI